MVLGKVGPHDSIFIIEGDEETPQSVNIRNACLSVVHSHMSSKDKFFIREKICSLFNLEEIKQAREVLYKSCDPNTVYRYQGPHKKTATDRDKVNDAFEGIFSKLIKLDAEDKLPKFSVPSEDLLKLLSTGDHTPCVAKFDKVHSEIEELKKTFHSFVSVVTSSNPTPLQAYGKLGTAAIPQEIRKRLTSTGSKRDASELSDNDIFTETENEQDFELPRTQRKKTAKRARVVTPPKDAKSFSEAAKSAPKPKPPAAWGTDKSVTTFKSAISELFIYNANVSVKSEDVTNWFKLKDVGVRAVEKLSHEYATRTSFKVTPLSNEDYEKILSGQFLPDGIAVRKFIPRRYNAERKESISGNQFRLRNSGDNSFRSELESAAMQLDNILAEGTTENGTSSTTPHDG